MSDLAALGIQVDSSSAASAATNLNTMAKSADTAGKSTDSLSSSSQKLIQALADQIVRIQAAGAAANTTTAYIDKLMKSQDSLSDSVAQQSSIWKAANDNIGAFAGTISSLPTTVENTSKSFLHTTIELIKFAGYIELAGKVVYNASPALQKFAELIGDKTSKAVDALHPSIVKLGDAVSSIHPAFGLAGAKITDMTTSIGKATAVVAPFYAILGGAEVVKTAANFTALTGAAVALSPAVRDVARSELWTTLKNIPSVLSTMVSGLTGFSGALGFIARIAAPIFAVVAAFKLITSAVEAGNEQLDGYIKKLNEIGDTEFPAEFFLKMEKAAADADVSLEDIHSTMEKFSQIAEPKLEGSDLANQIKALQKAGNFEGLDAIQEFRDAGADLEKQFTAIGHLLDQATDKGERLAALEIARTFQAKSMLDLQKQSGDTMSEMIDKAQKLSNTKIMDPDIAIRADELNDRLDDAYTKFKKILDPIAGVDKLALAIRESWVNIVESAATFATYLTNALGVMTKLKAAQTPQEGVNAIGVGFVPSLSPGQIGVALASEQAQGLLDVDEAQRKVIVSAKTYASTEDAQAKAARLAATAEKDLSNAVNTAQWNTAVEQITRHTATLIANANTVSKTADVQEQLRVEAQLLNAASKAGADITDKQIDQYIVLRSTMEANEARTAAGITLNGKYAKSFDDIAEKAGEANLALLKANAAIQLQQQLQTNVIATQALTAFLPAQKGEIAAAQTRLKLEQDLIHGIVTREQVEEQASSARKLAMDTEIRQLTEAARARALSANQAIATTQVEIDALNKNAAEQYRLQAIEQTRQQLEQDASARHAQLDQAELERLTEKINQNAKLKQTYEELKVASDISFSKQTALFTPEDVQIAQQLKNLYANDIPTAMASTQAAAMRTNQLMQGIGNAITNSVSSGLVDLITHTKSAKQAFQDMTTGILRGLTDIIVKMVIIGPLMRALGGAFGLTGTTAPVIDLKNPTFDFMDAAAGTSAFRAKGGVEYGMGISAYANSIVNHPTYFPFAKGGVMGEAGPEAIMPLSRGPDGSLGVKAQDTGTSGLKVEVNNYAGDSHDVKTSTRDGPDGETFVIDIVKKAQARGDFDNSNQSLYGLRRRKVV